MRRLPLYPRDFLGLGALPRLAVEEATPERVGAVQAQARPACSACGLFDGVRSPQMGAEGTPGGLLVVGDAPQVEDDRRGVPFVSATTGAVRALVQRFWKGPVVYDHAIRCAPGARVVGPPKVTACRPLLAAVLQEARPERVLLLGAQAQNAVIGRSFHMPSARRGYALLSTGVPAFLLQPPAVAMRNRYHRASFEADLEWALSARVAPPPVDGVAALIETPEDAEDAVFDLHTAGEIALDTETFGAVGDREFRVTTLALAAIGCSDAYVWDARALADPACLAPLVRLLEDPRVRKVGQNLKFDKLAVAFAFKANVRGSAFDARLVRKLLHADMQANLDVMQPLVGMGGGKDDAEEAVKAEVAHLRAALTNLQPTYPSGRPRVPRAIAPFGLPPEVEALMLQRVASGVDPRRYAYGLIDPAVRDPYCARDAVSTMRLRETLGAALAAQPELARHWREVVLPMEHAITAIERNGIRVDMGAVRQLQKAMDAKEAELRARLAPYVWEGFNPSASARDTAKLLFNAPTDSPPGLGLQPKRTTATGLAGTSVDDIEHIKHPAVAMILELRRVLHFRTQYADGTAAAVRDDGRVRTSYKIDGTVSGRPSTTEPNLLNIPRAESPEGKMCRDLFVAAPGFVLVEADYNQVELRVAALLSGDVVMGDVFRSGRDFHLETARLVAPIMGVDPETVDKAHPLRSRAKTTNFGLLYGKEVNGLAAELGISRKESQTLVDAILGKFRQLATWSRAVVDEARRTGECRTWWAGAPARRRPLPELGSPVEDERRGAERAAVNTPIQGTAAEFTNASLGALQRWIEEEGLERDVRLVLTVYDSIVAEVREGYVQEFVAAANRIMTGWDSGPVPLVADFKAGPSWGSMEGVLR